MTTPGSLNPDTQFVHYRIVRLLGRGGMGEVYEVEHRVLERKYALKLLPQDFATRSEAVRRFEREAKVMANLEHPHIVRVDEFGETNGRYWLRMELVHGVGTEGRGQTTEDGGQKSAVRGSWSVARDQKCCITLGDYAASRDGRIEQAELAGILKQVLEAVAYAHEQGVVHRDLKPGNILLEKDPQGLLLVKVSDFGLARVIGEELIRSQAQMSVTQSLSLGAGKLVGGTESIGDAKTLNDEGTSTRALLGTWEYMSPEQRRGEEADARSDVYALGLICYRLLTGEELGMRTPSQLEKSLNPAWDELVAKALEQKPNARFANGREMLDVFLGVRRVLSRGVRSPGNGDQVSPPQLESSPKSPITARKSRAPLIVASALALLLVCLAGWYFGSERPRQEADQKRRVELARIEAEARAAKDGKEKARLEADAERLRTEREKQQAADKVKAEAEQRERERRANAKGGLLVESMPAGATVMLGGEDVQTSPAKFKGIKIGKYPLRLTLDRYEPVSREVEIKENDFTNLGTVALVRSMGHLQVSSDPAGATYELSGAELETRRGTTPALVKDLPIGSYSLMMRRGDWEQSAKVTVRRGETVESKVAFGYGSVSVKSEPSGATVVAGGKELGTTPFELKEVRPGLVSYTLKLARHKEASVSGTVVERQALRLTGTLPKQVYPVAGEKWENSLGMGFVPVAGTEVLFCVWETRVRDFEAFANASGHDATSGMYSLKNGNWGQNGDTWKSPGFSQGPTHPVCGVSWEDTKAFCEWLSKKERADGKISAGQSYRLPREVEWNQAVGSTKYPWGDEWPPPQGAGNYAGSEAKDENWPSYWATIKGYRDNYARTAPVGSFAANRYGLYDLGGNVWEWCDDWYDRNQTSRVLRGASWYHDHPDYLLSSHRDFYSPDFRNYNVGFRCVLVVGTSP